MRGRNRQMMKREGMQASAGELFLRSLRRCHRADDAAAYIPCNQLQEVRG